MKKTTKQPQLPKRLESDLAVQEQEGRITNVKHFANPGDLVAVMAAIKRFWEVTRRKVLLLQQVDQLASYYNGATHPTVDSAGRNVCMNDSMFEMCKPLIESQAYIHKMEKYQGQRVDLDFDVIRNKTFVGMPNLMLQSWVFFAFPDLSCDLSKPWIHLEDVNDHPIRKQVNGKVILNFTERYRSEPIDYFFLKNYAPEIIFAGTEREHWLFCNQWQLSIPRLEVSNFLEYAYAIKYSRFLMGCQTLGWNIAQALGTRRVVELCRYAPNVQPGVGENSHGYFHQLGAEYYFRRMFNETA